MYPYSIYLQSQLVLSLETRFPFRVSVLQSETTPDVPVVAKRGRHSLGSDNQSGGCLRHRDPRVIEVRCFTIDTCQVIPWSFVRGCHTTIRNV